jgi:hypothetical protein
MAAGQFNVTQQILHSRSNNLGAASTLRFPEDIGNHYMLFMVKDYVRIPSTHPGLMKKTLARFVLPIPLNFRENFHTATNQAGMYMGYNAVNALGSITNDFSLDNIERKITGLGATIADNSGKVAAAVIQQAFTGSKSNLLRSIKTSIEASTGQIINPNFTLLFQGVPLRTHNYTWTLSPESLKESSTLGEIINLIKTKMLPTSSTANMVLNFPSVFDISVSGSNDVNWQVQFKTAFLTGLEVNRAPQQVASFSRGNGAPSNITLTLQFKEVESFVAEDINASATGPGSIFNGVINSAQSGFNSDVNNIINTTGINPNKTTINLP